MMHGLDRNNTNTEHKSEFELAYFGEGLVELEQNRKQVRWDKIEVPVYLRTGGAMLISS